MYGLLFKFNLRPKYKDLVSPVTCSRKVTYWLTKQWLHGYSLHTTKNNDRKTSKLTLNLYPFKSIQLKQNNTGSSNAFVLSL